jgi:hypothetical protein
VLTISVTDRSLPEDTLDIAWLYLPAEDCHIERTLQRAGIQYEDMRLQYIDSELPAVLIDLLGTEENLHELNKLCASYQKMDEDCRDKLEGVLQIVTPSNLTQAWNLLEQLDLFDFMENAPPLKAIDLNDKYKLLAEYNGVVLAGTDMGPQNGYQFVTWLYSYEHKGVVLGHYYPNKYAEAKEDFAIRSELIPEHRLFDKKQMMDIYRAVKYSLEERTDLTFMQEDNLKDIKKQIERTLPDAAVILKAELTQEPGFKMEGI